MYSIASLFRRMLPVASTLLLLAGCSSTTSTSPLALIGGDTLSQQDYRAYFQKQGRPLPPRFEDRKSVLDRMVDHHVKVKEAEAKGIFRESSVLEEIQQYRTSIAIPYLLDQVLAEPGMRMIYAQRKSVLRAQQILIRFTRDYSGRVDTMAAMIKAQAILKSALTPGVNFDSLLLETSDDINKVYTRGNTGWLVAGNNVGDFENLLATLAVGEVGPRCVRSPIGYHIVKLLDRRPNRERLLASHILYRLDTNSPEDTAAGYATLSLILDSLRSGKATFEELARRNSQDSSSGAQGGSLGWVERGTDLEPHFESALYELPVKGVSNIVRTPFGLHIIRCDGELMPRTYEEQRSILRRMYQSTRFLVEYARFSEALRARYRFTPMPEVYQRIAARFDSSVSTSTPDWMGRFTDKERQWVLFRYTETPGTATADRTFTIQDLATEVRKDQRLQMRKFTISSLDSMSAFIADRIFLLIEARDLERNSPEFGAIMKEYVASTAITALESLMVMGNITVTEQDLRAFWEPRKSEFRWPDRVAISEIYLYDKGRAEAILDSVRRGGPFAALAARHTRRVDLVRAGGAWGLQPVESHDLLRFAWKMNEGEIAGLLKADIGWSVIRVDKKDPAREKTFDEVRSEIETRVRQQRFEAAREEWVAKLREKYQVRQFDDVLRTMADTGK